MTKQRFYISLLLYAAMWSVWSVWMIRLSPMGGGSVWAALLEALLAKPFVWILPPALLLWRDRGAFRSLFASSFPWIPCFVALCLTVAFLYTLRLVNGLQGTYAVFDPMFLAFSLSAGVVEELSFRGCFFLLHKESLGLWAAAALNGVLFTLYHYPGLLFGLSWGALLSLRALLLFVMGAVFCFLFWRWRNLALTMTVHTVWNLLSYLFCLAG